MFIESFEVHYFKSLQDFKIHFNSDINILTGANNSGKTTVLEAISLWHECFSKLITQTKSKEKNYRKGDWILGPSYNRYFPFDQINSVQSPNFEDIFFQRDKRRKIILNAIVNNRLGEKIEIPFRIGSSGSNYVIELSGYSRYSHRKFNDFFLKLPDSISLVYSSPVASINTFEDFVTDPNIRSRIIERASFEVLRNRMYKLLTSPDPTVTSSFISRLNYILFNNEKELTLHNRSNIQRDKRVLINYHIGKGDVEKDIALLGSGTLQIIEILLNLYQPGESLKELNLIMLDEPDSHIHRDIQMRLLFVIKQFFQQKQIFISTHNESLIRNADYQNLFHLSGKSVDEVKSISANELEKIAPRFKGLYPMPINTVIRSVGAITGLDFINAIECERLIFVEGEDDARVFNRLLKLQINNKKKYMFWVLGGIDEVFENINAYEHVFSKIENGKSLWSKSTLIIDRDFLSDEIVEEFKKQLFELKNLVTNSCSSYTFESSLFTDFEKMAKLVTKFVSETKNKVDPDFIKDNLVKEYKDFKEILKERFNTKFIETIVYRYQNVRNKTDKLFKKNRIIDKTDIQLGTVVREYIDDLFQKNLLYKLMNKEDVGIIINKVTSYYDVTFSIETDFIEIIKLVDDSTWIQEWDFINTL